tara:strand:+ start:86 stop:238 length:153 start_codon:yes stop_codon:yes gene_type:complete
MLKRKEKKEKRKQNLKKSWGLFGDKLIQIHQERDLLISSKKKQIEKLVYK